jgi:hypothetical protein
VDALAPSGRLDAFLRAARRAYPRELVPDAAFAKAEAVAAGLPPAFGFILECWLGGEAADVDAQFYFREGEGGALAAGVPGSSPTWRAVRELFGAWGEERSLFEGLWLEYDLGEGDGGPSAPRVGFACSGVAHGASPQRRAAYRAAHARCLDALAPGLPRDGRLERTLEAALDALPPGSRLYGTGFAPPPAVSPLRWCVSLGAEAAGAAAFLSALRWPETGAFMAALPRPAGLRSCALNCDLGDGLGPKVGMEFYLDEGAWRPFLDELVRRGLCRPRWVEPLLFPARAYGAADCGPDWPEPLAALESVTRRPAAVYSRLAHVKLVWERGAWRDAKAYLYGSYA